MADDHKLLKNETGLIIAEHLEKIAAAEIAQAEQGAAEISYEAFQKLVRSGIAKLLYPVGTVLVIPWTDKTNNTVYQVPHIVAHHGTAMLASGEEVPSCILVWKYLPPYGVQFSESQALYYSEQGEPADDYWFNIPTTWSKAVAGDYHFTLTQPVPAGGQMVGPRLIADTDPANWTVKTYASPSSTTPIETVPVVAGQAGTSLGQLTPAGTATLNSIHRVGYGSNRYKDSAIRQWLNSAAGIGGWWTPQSNYDRPPEQLATKPGFLSGYADDFLAILSPSKVVTALNTVSDASIGQYEETYDKVFLPSLEEIFCTPQLAGVEGEAWELYKRLVGQTVPASTYPTTYDAYKMRGIENPTGGAQIVRLRSAHRGTAYNTWYMNTSGSVSTYSYACNAIRGLPALEIK